ncbi:tetratricopeptide repeat protein [Tropicibacter sp. Alg240-R139]|uniref:tetratricopeptide repeat protein n=1 Tax=Tropicibacter sp. Alg240-R139 TaxID=2305991 RepID=UPI0013DF9216|nr:hypothetical protein [Tropicibacter sp. Alg240-R139]
MSTRRKTDHYQSVDESSHGKIEAALKRLNESAGLSGSARLQEFLSYVVGETLAGRGSQIRGKSVAVDVYGRSLEEDAGLNLVRVEARRLRRLLTEYYDADGKHEPVHILIDAGGYRPRFEFTDVGEMEDKSENEARSPSRGFWPWSLAAVAAIAAIGMGAVMILRTPGTGPHLAGVNDPQRAALRQHSVLSLQAKNIAGQAQGMLFPVFDLKRQELALGMFRHAIELDPSLSDGHAGAGQTMTVLGMFSPDQNAAAAYRQDAIDSTRHALKLAPINAWANGANGFALAASGDYEAAIRYAKIAEQLAPNDGHVRDLIGMTAIIADEAKLAALASDPKVRREGIGRFGSRNIWAVSQLMLGNYPETIEAFEGAAASGAPVSPPSLLFQAVAYDQMGDDHKAKALMSEMYRTWPEFPALSIVDAMFREGSHVKRVVLKTLEKSLD